MRNSYVKHVRLLSSSKSQEPLLQPLQFNVSYISSLALKTTSNKQLYLSVIPTLCWFFLNFCVCGETNAAKCLVTNQTIFYIVGPTKKLSLKRNFYEVVFTYFFN